MKKLQYPSAHSRGPRILSQIPNREITTKFFTPFPSTRSDYL